MVFNVVGKDSISMTKFFCFIFCIDSKICVFELKLNIFWLLIIKWTTSKGNIRFINVVKVVYKQTSSASY